MKSKRLLRIISMATLTTSLVGMKGVNAQIVDGAKYYYTIDGSDPATSSTRIEWTDPSIPQTITAPDVDEESEITVKVVAIKDGFQNSDVVEKKITFAAKQFINAPILDPSTAQTYPNRDTDNYFDIKNTNDEGVNYYYTIDGTTPTADNGILVVDKAICLNGPDTDAKTVYNLKVVAEKNGNYSEITSVRITYSAKEGTEGGTGGETDTISNPVISFNKSNPYNRQSDVKAFITGKKSGVNYYYTLDGTEPTESSNVLSNSYIDLDAPDVDTEETVTVWVKGFKDGYVDEISAVQSITYAAKQQNIFYVTFKDRTYNDIEIVEYNKGEPILSKAPTPPDVDGYEFIGWSNEDANVEKNMIVRAMYEKIQQDVEVHNPTETVILAEEDSSENDQVLITNSWPGVKVRVYTDEYSDETYYDGVVDSDGECLIDVGKLSEQGGQVWVAYDLDGAKSRAFSARKPVSYPSRAIAQIYSLPIPSSRLALEDETTLIVRGIESGETVNVYDKDNELIGSAKQGRAPLMSISLDESVDAGNVYVARVTPGRLESQQTELTKADLVSNNATQSLLNVKQQIITAFNSSDFDKNTNVSAIEDIINGSITLNDSSITGSANNFTNDNGHIKVDIYLENTVNGDTLNFSLDKDFNKDITFGTGSGSQTGQTAAEVLEAIKNEFNGGTYTKDTNSDELFNLVKHLFGADITVQINTSNDKNGNISVYIQVADSVGGTASDNINLTYIDNEDEDNSDTGNDGPNNGGSDNGTGNDGSNNGGITSDNIVKIELSGDQYVDLVAEKIKIYLDGYEPTNSSDKEILNSKFQEILRTTTSSGVELEINDWDKVNSTNTNKGVLKFIVNVFNDIGDKAKVTFDKYIDKIAGSDTGNGDQNESNGGNTQDSDFDKAVEEVQKYLNKLSASNSTKKSTVKSKIENICDKYDVNSSIDNWDLEKSTKSKKGYLSFDVYLEKGEEHKTLYYEDDISKKSSSSSSSSSSSGTTSDSTSDSTSNSTGGSASNSSDSNKPNIGIIVDGNGNSEGNTGQISNGSTADGTTTDIVDKDGNIIGTVVDVTKPGNVIIQVGNGGSGSGGGNVTSAGSNVILYKFEPITGRYIRMPDGFTVDNQQITFQAQANESYYVATKELDASLVLQQGWNLVNGCNYRLDGIALKTGWIQEGTNWYWIDSNTFARVDNSWRQVNEKWYYLGTDGVMQTGWLLDKGNWYYLNPWSGEMATGWKQVGSQWYYLHAYNGAMQTGWHQIGYHWYYMHQDGHMAANEIINGYYLNSDGRWV